MARIKFFLVEMKLNDLRTHYKIVLYVTSRTVGITFYWYVKICACIINIMVSPQDPFQVRKFSDDIKICMNIDLDRYSKSYWSTI